MGSKIFTSTWDTAACAAYCDSQTAYNKATAPKDGTPYKICNFYNTYVLTAYKADGSVVPQGQYCALYTEAWPIKYATNGGQWRGKDQYLVSYSFGFPKANPGIDPTVGDTTGAVYQARQDMTYSPSSLTAVFQPFCSSLLGYSVPIASATALTTVTPVVTTTVVTTSFAAANAKRAAASLSTPAVLTKYPSSIFRSACSLIATSPTVTSTITVTTSTSTAATSTVVATSTTVVQVKGTPNTGCTGAVCGHFIGGCSAQDSCTCYTSAEGPGYCAQDAACRGTPRCNSSADCGASQVCAVNTCCGAKGICLNLTCSNPSRMLMRMARRQDVQTSRNDGSNQIGS